MGPLARHLNFFDSFLIWDMWIIVPALINYHKDPLGQISKCWTHLYHDKGELNNIYDWLAWIPTISTHRIMYFDFQPTKPPNYRYIFATYSTFHPVYFQRCEQRAMLYKWNTFEIKYEFPWRYFDMSDKMPCCYCGIIRQAWKAVFIMTIIHLCLSINKPRLFEVWSY